MSERKNYCPFITGGYIKCPATEDCYNLKIKAYKGIPFGWHPFDYNIALRPIGIIERGFQKWKDASDKAGENCIFRYRKALDGNITCDAAMLIKRFLRGPYIPQEDRACYDQIILK